MQVLRCVKVNGLECRTCLGCHWHSSVHHADSYSHECWTDSWQESVDSLDQDGDDVCLNTKTNDPENKSIQHKTLINKGQYDKPCFHVVNWVVIHLHYCLVFKSLHLWAMKLQRTDKIGYIANIGYCSSDKEIPRSKSPLLVLRIVWYIVGATTNIGQWNFVVSGPTTWNRLPASHHSLDCLLYTSPSPRD